MSKKDRTRKVPKKQNAEKMKDFSADKTDPQGSYTGCPRNPEEKPVQDADDL